MNSYLITPQSKKHLKYTRRGWTLPAGAERFRSLRTARVYLKRNRGLMNIEAHVQLPGVINMVAIEGTFSL